MFQKSDFLPFFSFCANLEKSVIFPGPGCYLLKNFMIITKSSIIFLFDIFFLIYFIFNEDDDSDNDGDGNRLLLSFVQCIRNVEVNDFNKFTKQDHFLCVSISDPQNKMSFSMSI